MNDPVLKIYTGDIVAGALLMEESRKIAALLLEGDQSERWRQAIVIDNILQKRSPKSAKRQANLIRSRLALMSEDFWNIIVEGSSETTSQALLAASIRHSRLVGDFMDTVLRLHWRTFSRHITPTDWKDHLNACEQIDPRVASWKPSTRDKLRQVVFRVLAESGYIDNTRTCRLMPVSLVPDLRMSLSSVNTDEVIQARLLEKHDNAASELAHLFDQKGDILKSQLGFTHGTATLNLFSSPQDFINNYPFIPYHFQLVQKIFESIRKAGATGLHLSRGERSMLDAFQSAAMNIAHRSINALVPLHEFFPCIESFLDTSVKRSIEQAKGNSGLQAPLDIQILQTLFIIRYVGIIKPNVDNLVTLSIDQVDADRIVLKQNIDEALVRLEKENLISRNGDLYFFLTNEEREVSREIKSIEISSHAETDLLGTIIFEDILKGKTKHKYLPYKRDYAFNRICDDKPWGKKLEHDLTKTSQWKHVQILEKPALSSGDLKKAQQLGKDIFGTLARMARTKSATTSNRD